MRRKPGRALYRIVHTYEDGAGHAIGDVEVPNDPWAPARYLLSRIDAFADDPRVVEWAARWREFGDEAPRLLQRWVQENIEFRLEDGEIFQAPWVTLARGYGDCDDHTALVGATLAALGFPVTIAFLANGRYPRHVFPVAFVGGAWRVLETTVKAFYGEEPQAAAKRLAVNRPDMTHFDTMAGVGSGGGGDGGALARAKAATSRLSDRYIQRIVDIGRECNADPVDIGAVIEFESGNRPDAQNPTSLATGLMQWLPKFAPRGMPIEKLKTLSAETQIEFVAEWFRDAKKKIGSQRMTRGMVYATVFCPGRLSPTANDSTLCFSAEDGRNFTDNPLLNVNGDDKITIGELAEVLTRVRARKSFQPLALRIQAAAAAAGGGGTEPSGGGGKIPGVAVAMMIAGAAAFAWSKT